MTSTSPHPTDIPHPELDRLTSHLDGAVVPPGAPGFAQACAGFNLATQHSPDLLVQAAHAEDVATTVAWASSTGRRVVVQATGHGTRAAGPGTVLLSTAALDTVEVDPVERTATVGAGARWQAVLDAAAPFGLAPLAGSSPSVGAVGYTVGGGWGPVARTFGASADHVRSFEVVTPDGVARRVDAEQAPELFFALRGGGGGFAVVTRMTIDLLPVRELYAGGLWFPVDVARTVAHAWRRWVADLPESMTTSLARVDLPALPELPEPLRGGSFVHVRVAHVGDPAEGARLVAPLREVVPPLLDSVGVLPYAALGAIHADPVAPMPSAERSTLLRELPAAALEAFLEMTPSGGPVVVAEIRVLGGALARPAAVPNAVAGRGAAFQVLALGVPAGPGADALPGALQAVLDRLSPWSTGGALPNFAGGDQAAVTRAVVTAFEPAVHTRLGAIRQLVDPDGILDPGSRWGRQTSTEQGGRTCASS